MSVRVDHLLDEALSLPPDERSALVVALLDSLEGSEDAGVFYEIDGSVVFVLAVAHQRRKPGYWRHR